jgi:phosphatidylglycerol lysyltransferase
MGVKSLVTKENLKVQEGEELLHDLRRFGDRTSSFMTAYPGFSSFHSSNQKFLGQIRYMSTRRALIAATEPLCTAERRVELFSEFAEYARSLGKRAAQTPVGEAYARAAEKNGLYSLQIGSEAVFDLEEYFSRAKDPLQQFSHARSLRNRGGRVVQLDPNNLPPETEAEMRRLTNAWLNDKTTKQLSFLNQVDPFHMISERAVFAFFFDGKLIAFLATTPVYPERSVFFADYIRDRDSKAGTMEMLFIESMRLLRAQGIREVRLGTCLFAGLPDSGTERGRRPAYRVLSWMFRNVRFPLNFESIHRFKAKFKPSRWEPMFLVSDRKPDLLTALDLTEVISGQSLFSSLVQAVVRALGGFPFLVRRIAAGVTN